MIELLAPAGSWEALTAAVESGADAIYLAGKMFGARAYAANFSQEELTHAVNFAHLRGVRIYVTVNTLVDDSEVPELIVYLRQLYEVGVDAIIVQDVGVADIARRVVPDMPLHASTQMTIHNVEGVQFLADLGFARVVVAREMTLQELGAICHNTTIEIEAFVHGALCISYSGQCLMSSMIGGRSGNRGRCAQPCRLPYTLVDKNGHDVIPKDSAGEYLLSPRDLNTLQLLPQLIEAGVTSFKIEGRMKRPEYVAVVVDTYRRAIDGYLLNKNHYDVDVQEHKNLAQIFNRDFTTAYLEKKQGRDMMSDRRPNNRGVRIGRVVTYNHENKTAVIKLDEPLFLNDIIDFWVKVGGRVSVTVAAMHSKGQPVTQAAAGEEVAVQVTAPVRVNDRVFKVFDAGLMEKARAFFKDATARRRIPIDVTVVVSEGQPLSIQLIDADGFQGQARTKFIAERAVKRPLSQDSILKQVERLGTTVFSIRDFRCLIQGEVMVPVSEINEARRTAVEELEAARKANFKRKTLPSKIISVKDLAPIQAKKADGKRKTLLNVNVDTLEKVRVSLENGADIIMFGGESFQHQSITAEDYQQAVQMVKNEGKEIILNTPRIIKPGQMNALQLEIKHFAKLQPHGIAVSNLGSLKLVSDVTDTPLYGDYPLNIYNRYAVQFFAERGFKSLTLSPELTMGQIENLLATAAVPLACLVHGYLTLMVSEYCAVGSFIGNLHTGSCTKACLKGEFWLKDRKGEMFPIVTDQYCRMHILNAKELSMLPHVARLSELGISQIRMEAKKTSLQELGGLIQLYRELLDVGDKHPLVVQDKLKSVEHEDITRGHYFRGVL